MVGHKVWLKDGRVGVIQWIKFDETMRELLFGITGENFLFRNKSVWWSEIETWL